MFRLLWKKLDGVEPAPEVYATHEEALESAKLMCQAGGTGLIVTQDLDEVQMAPTITSLLTTKVTQPTIVYRNAQSNDAEVAPDEPLRVPQIRPRLLVVNRRATPAELVGHLMVVAEGAIVKNSFGALEIGDMPLTPAELVEVNNALRRNIPNSQANH